MQICCLSSPMEKGISYSCQLFCLVVVLVYSLLIVCLAHVFSPFEVVDILLIRGFSIWYSNAETECEEGGEWKEILCAEEIRVGRLGTFSKFSREKNTWFDSGVLIHWRREALLWWWNRNNSTFSCIEPFLLFKEECIT